jgi:hypothetical protein
LRGLKVSANERDSFLVWLPFDKVVLRVLIPDRPVRANVLTALLEYASVLPQCPLPTLTMVVRRYFALHSADVFRHGLCRDLEDFCIRMIEVTCLDDGFRGHGLTTDPPAGAAIRYKWGKDHFTLADPMTQARDSVHTLIC